MLVAALVVLVLVVVASLAIGSLPVAPTAVWTALTGGNVSAEVGAAVVDLRLPRTVVGLAVGAALGASGALVQALTRNPLADPGVLGVTSGAGFFVALAIAFFGVTAPAGYLWFALGGAFVTTVAVFAIGALGRQRLRPEQLLLAGVALSAVLAGVVSAIRLSDPRRFDVLRVWESGALRDRGWDVLLPALPFLAIGGLLALLLGGPLNALSLGEDRASALGASVVRTRITGIVAITLLAGAGTAVAGPIAFVGLMIPHLARRMVGPDQRWIIAFSLVLAPALLLLADIAARLVVSPGEVPVGIVTAFLGAPVLIVLVRRKRVIGL
ncbi:MAG TPA: iron chelate uptake ABC transporter family permease subunit [Lacisediminihabitans sp.]